MVVGGTALFGGGRGGAAPSKALVEFRAGKMTTAAGKLLFCGVTYVYSNIKKIAWGLRDLVTFN